MVPEIDWFEWHQRYDDPRSRASRRLAAVQRVLRPAIGQLPPGPFVVVSLCAGQGHDILGVLAEHPRRDDALVTLIEADPRNVEQALERARAAGIPHVRGVARDAGVSDAFAGLPRAALVILAGFVVHISTADFVRLIGALPQVCDSGAIVVCNCPSHVTRAWSDRRVRHAFTAAGFEAAHLDVPTESEFGVRSERFTGEPQPFQPGLRLFTFVASPRRPSIWRRLKRRMARLKAKWA